MGPECQPGECPGGRGWALVPSTRVPLCQLKASFPFSVPTEQPYTVVPALPAAYSSLGVVLSLVALGALLVAVVALGMWHHRRQKGKQSRQLAVAYTAGQVDTSDYMVPGGHPAARDLCPPRLWWASGTELASLSPTDVPPGHHTHHYSNPSYHTLSQCPGHPGSHRAGSLKVWHEVAWLGWHGVRWLRWHSWGDMVSVAWLGWHGVAWLG